MKEKPTSTATTLVDEVIYTTELEAKDAITKLVDPSDEEFEYEDETAPVDEAPVDEAQADVQTDDPSADRPATH